MAIFLRKFSITTVWTLALVCALTASAGSPQESQKPQASSSGKPQDQDQPETFKVDVGLVNIFFNVKDKHGEIVTGLKKEDFELAEDGQKQTIKYFAAETDLPLTLGILVDTSGSQMRVLPMEQEVGAAFMKQVLHDQ